MRFGFLMGLLGTLWDDQKWARKLRNRQGCENGVSVRIADKVNLCSSAAYSEMVIITIESSRTGLSGSALSSVPESSFDYMHSDPLFLQSFQM